MYHFSTTWANVVCAGYQVAARNLFIVISRLLYCFDFEYAGVH